MTLLSIAQDVADETGFARPSALVGNTDSTARRLLSLANREGKELASRHPWQALVTPASITTDTTGSYSLPADFDRPMTQTWWDSTNFRELRSATSPETWQILQYGIITAAGITQWVRIRGDNILLFPDTTSGLSLRYEYVTNQWAQNAAGDTFYAAWNADDDTGRISEDLMTLGLIWRWRKSTGLDFEKEESIYNRAVDRAIARDAGRRVVDQSRRKLDRERGVNTPEGNFG